MDKFDTLKHVNRQFLKTIGVGKSHSGGHLDDVIELSRKGLESIGNKGGIPEDAEKILEAAAELHESDDSKYGGDGTLRNAKRIMEECGYTGDFIKRVLKVISLVSCSSNRDEVPSGTEEWELIVREADRLTGVCLIRLAEYNEESRQPIYTANTAKATTLEELYRIATPERYAAYRGSVSSVDHVYDKILHILKAIRNPYLRLLVGDKQERVERMCLKFGQTGTLTCNEMREFATMEL